jgi:hypothetical protein
VILLCGIASEAPLAMVAAELRSLGAPPLVFNQRAFADAEIAFSVGPAVSGTLRLAGRTIPLEEITGVYTRMMDDRQLPELEREPAESDRRRACRALHDRLARWIEIAPGRVVNRAFAMGSNSSKPYQAQILRDCGFDVPETLVTNDPDLVLEFRARHQRVVFKSISGCRSIVRELDAAAQARLHHIRWCPVQFQELVEGVDVRVHVVGDEVFPTRILSDAIDYRYASAGGGAAARLEPVVLSDAVAERCVKVSERLGLPFTGIDLRVTPGGRVVCFEVNPCPGFSYYESHTGQPIANAVARYLRDGAR